MVIDKRNDDRGSTGSSSKGRQKCTALFYEKDNKGEESGEGSHFPRSLLSLCKTEPYTSASL